MKKKFWIGILTAVLLLNLLPGMTPSASADDTQSQETLYHKCPECKTVQVLKIIGYVWKRDGYQVNATQHWQLVLCPSCEKEGYLAGDDHTGGDETPTCTTGKTCKKCGGEYGILGHDWSEVWTSNGNGTHSRTCRRDGCDAVDSADCGGDGSATCVTPGTCTACGAEYYGGHTFPERWIWESDTQVGRDAGSHWVWCLYCTEGKANYSSHSFSPGNMYLKSPATCVSKPVYYVNCHTCYYKGTDTYEYGWGNLDPNNHTGVTEVRGAVAPTCTQDGYTGDTYCKDCDALLSSGTAIPADGRSHTGGTATCLRQAVCEDCGERYGGIDRSNHVSGCEPEWTVTETEHVQKYSRCGKVITESGAHAFSDWTVTREATADETGEQERICELCEYTETEAIPATGEEVPEASPTPVPIAAPEPTAEPAEQPAAGGSAWWIIVLIVIAGAGAGIAVRRKKKE